MLLTKHSVPQEMWENIPLLVQAVTNKHHLGHMIFLVKVLLNCSCFTIVWVKDFLHNQLEELL